MRGLADDFGNWLGNFGNSWAGGEDQAMYADPGATMASPGGATYAGVQNYGQAVQSVLPDPRKFLLTLAGVAIILFTVIDS